MGTSAGRYPSMAAGFAFAGLVAMAGPFNQFSLHCAPGEVQCKEPSVEDSRRIHIQDFVTHPVPSISPAPSGGQVSARATTAPKFSGSVFLVSMPRAARSTSAMP